MQYEIRKIETDEELSHHGIIGQKWGIRRYQYKDGSLTDEGRKRYGSPKSNISKWSIRAKNAISDVKQSYKESSEAKKKKQIEKEKAKEEAAEAEKKRLVELGTPEQIQKNIRKFNAEELSQIERRFSTELRVQDEIKRLTKSDKVETPVVHVVKPDKVNPSTRMTNATNFVSNNLKNVESSVSNGVKVYNNFARIHNLFRPNEQEWKIIPEKEKKDNQNPSGGNP